MPQKSINESFVLGFSDMRFEREAFLGCFSIPMLLVCSRTHRRWALLQLAAMRTSISYNDVNISKFASSFRRMSSLYVMSVVDG